MAAVDEGLLRYDNDVYEYGGRGGGGSVCVPGVACCVFWQEHRTGAADSFFRRLIYNLT